MYRRPNLSKTSQPPRKKKNVEPTSQNPRALRDERNRVRYITVGFRVSPEQNEKINAAVAISGLSKQEYCYRRCLCQDVVVQGNPRVFKGLKDQLDRVLSELERLNTADEICPETLETIQLIAVVLNDMPADVISSELRTQRNTLSFWRIESLDEIDKAVLALAASSNSKHIEKIDVVCIPEEEIRSSSIEMNEDSPGDTIVSDLVELHRDLCSINYQTLGVISSLINNYMHRDLHKKFSRKQVKDYLLQAYRDNRICKDMCNDSLLSEIEAMV